MPDSVGPSDYFEGTIFARGLQLPASPSHTAPFTEDQVQWIVEATGELIAQVFAAKDNTLFNFLTLQALGGGNGVIAELVAVENLKAGAFTVAVNGGIVQLNLSANAINRTLLSDTQKSDFLQALAESGLKVIRGTVSTTLPTILSGSGFSVVRNGVGNVTITFTSAFSGPASAEGTVTDGIVDHGSIVTTANSTRFRVYNDAATLQEGTIEFIAIGPI